MYAYVLHKTAYGKEVSSLIEVFNNVDIKRIPGYKRQQILGNEHITQL